ncbi:NHL repeat-containing protein 2 [Nymphaea thermarum]|nr:NHL repeat-containing protein 2 [Nymphaea thermarum]
MDKGTKFSFNDGVFLVVVDVFLHDSPVLGFNKMVLVERVKLLQQRFPELKVFGLQCGAHITDYNTKNQISKMITNEYITFPVLVSSEKFVQMKDGTLYVLLNGLREPVYFFPRNVEHTNISKEIGQLVNPQKKSSSVLENFGSTWARRAEIVREPSVCSSLKNLLLDFAGCMSVDEPSNRIFLSDTNHHRIIIINGNGYILDSIGSSPGFEDGRFETAKLMRPAASVYNAAEDCLYFVDSENHAVRCADFEKRIVHTVYPAPESNKNTRNLWRWLLVKLGMVPQASENVNEHEMDIPCFPWHILKLEERNLFITNRSFDSLWILCTATGKIENSCKGQGAVMDFCKPVIKSRLAMAKETYHKLQLQCRINCNSLEELSYAHMISSVAKIEGNILLCDPGCIDGGKIIKYHHGSDKFSSLQFSNFGVLGLPYWLDCPLEVFSGRAYDAYVPATNRLLQHFNVHPGKCNIKIDVDVPRGTKLASPLQDGCFWCQARGSATVLRKEADSTAKVGVAQQWYDELDNLAFASTNAVSELNDEQAEFGNPQGDRSAHIDCCVSTSPGTSEIVVCAAFYLRLHNACEHGLIDDVRKVEKILAISSHEENPEQGEAPISLLLASCKDLSNVVFVRPLHLRIRLDCHDDSTDKLSEIIRTDSTIKIHVSLD